MVIIFDNSKPRRKIFAKNYIWHLTLCWSVVYVRPGRRKSKNRQIMLRKYVKEMLRPEFYIDAF